MTKADLVKSVSAETGIIRKDVAIIVDSLLETIVNSLKEGNHIEIRGFATFKTKKRNAREARNPKTGETVKVEERTVPSIKFSKDFKDQIAEAAK
ncbi:MAG: integration host factor subunit beta [Candidatus Cloacimonadota bacterium]|nr:MAG: integration host factor subunit beta [Candidatus Cloacimonadota bacterium]